MQETWLRLNRFDSSEVENLGGWLTTVVARVCLDALRTRKGRREDSVRVLPIHQLRSELTSRHNPEQEVAMADSVGLALLIVLDTLSPAERLAFVLHDVFAMPFSEIAPIIARTPVATKKLASRAVSGYKVRLRKLMQTGHGSAGLWKPSSRLRVPVT